MKKSKVKTILGYGGLGLLIGGIFLTSGALMMLGTFGIIAWFAIDAWTRLEDE